MIDKTVQYLVNKFKLNKHVEGGYYSEYYRSKINVDISNEGKKETRNLSTSIFFLLQNKDYSCWHKLSSDEIWYHHCGSPLNVYIINNLNEIETFTLGNPLEDDSAVPAITIRSNQWFAAQVKDSGEFSFVSCSVTPGFDFNDFVIASEKDLLEVKDNSLINKLLKV